MKQDFGNNIKLIPNLYIETGSSDLPYTQIDLMVFYKGHIYVLELKDYSGTLYGGYKSEQWKQVLTSHYRYKSSFKTYKRSTSVKIPNPIKQNQWHIKYLKRRYHFSYVNIVLFNCKASLKAPSHTVMHYNDFYKLLKNEAPQSEDAMTEAYYRFSLLNEGKSKEVVHNHRVSIKNFHR